MPVVYMDRFELAEGHSTVCSDHYNAGYLAARHFLARGRRRLAFLGADVAPFRERMRGYRKAMEEAAVQPDERLLMLVGREASNLSVITRIVRAGADCIFAPGSSFQAIECLHVLSYVMGIKVPEQISLIGGENEGISALQNPPLTTIQEPLKEMAEKAVMMIERITAGDRSARKNLILPVRLIERDSVA
jgi:LacI family transcriptional regulator